MSHRILIVDDNEDNILSTRVLLEMQGYLVDSVISAQQAIDLLRAGKKTYALILMDYDMPGMNGAEASREILKTRSKQLIAMYTCFDTMDVVKETLRSGLVAFLEKHTEPELLLARIAELCSKYDQTVKPIASDLSQGEVQRLVQSVGLRGQSKSLVEMASTIVKYAPQSQTVVIRGESGTGKELIAQALHALSPRKNNPFVAVNCAAMPESLLESILFGHEKGSFTGAMKNQVDKFALASHGTLFLDEIGDMPLGAQVKLLRVLQEGVVEPVGSNRDVKVDVRVIAASHRNLREQVDRGLFREDLYFRLNVLEIEVAPLRNRPDDIEPLVAFFTEEYCKSRGIEKHFERATLPFLKAYAGLATSAS